MVIRVPWHTPVSQHSETEAGESLRSAWSRIKPHLTRRVGDFNNTNTSGIYAVNSVYTQQMRKPRQVYSPECTADSHQFKDTFAPFSDCLWKKPSGHTGKDKNASQTSHVHSLLSSEQSWHTAMATWQGMNLCCVPLVCITLTREF